MQLFNFQNDEKVNLLPSGGIVNYYGKIFSQEDSNRYFNLLLNNVRWRNDEAIIFGKKIITKRKVAWYGDENYSYTYSKTTKSALLWTSELLILKKIVEEKTEEDFNSCLLNLYHNGLEGMSWHSDSEKDLKKDGVIAILSFGAERKFALKSKSHQNKVDLILEHGSLLIMKGKTQTNWLHSVPTMKKITKERISLTFRNIVRNK
ncbi:alpha-ketoglutarate-dependent dioxygenase AlkB family protein [Epilithonimonas hominis]|uniref:alpha-ketoglutarate-dependent dioxygenase AlkB family protein n=3 Tax=Epilithonimonas hominis TaxID=420404 RepID=UPI002897F142|nr:alpha-ketoglutarate-dependent dioxygenase AlkB [Epilithonimonas hominis]